MGKRKDIGKEGTPAKIADGAVAEGTAAKPARKRRLSVGTVIAALALVAGLAVIAYPTVSNWWNDLHQSRALDDYIEAVEQLDPEVIEQKLAEADAYNERLLSNQNRFFPTEADHEEYLRTLDIDGSGILGYIEVPALRIRYPIRHTADEDVIQVAIGHLEGTSLPVGGKGTHAAVTGHRGLPSAVLFTDLDTLEEGDTFTVTVLTRTMTYSVDQIRIVEPSDVEPLAIDLDADQMTLVTCTPYAINSHRLMVRGTRVSDADLSDLDRDANMVPAYLVVIGLALPLLVVGLGTAILLDRKKKARPTTQEAREAIRYLYEESKGDADDEDGAQ